MANAEKTQLRIVAYQDANGTWVAQCLEYDISTQASDIDSLVARMDATIMAEAKYTAEQNGSRFAGLGPAPAMYEGLFDRAKTTVTGDNEMRIAA